MNIELLRSKMDEYFKNVKPEELIAYFESLGYKFIPEGGGKDLEPDGGDSGEKSVAQGIYVASKTKHAWIWKRMRNHGYNIISTWIDEAEKSQTKNMMDLAERCIWESANCKGMIVYSQEGDYLKGAFIEMGVALAHNKPIVLVGEVLTAGSVFTHLPNVRQVETLGEALDLLNSDKNDNRSVAIGDDSSTSAGNNQTQILRGHYEDKERMEILKKHLGESAFYKTGEIHNAISDAMSEYAGNKKEQPVREVSGEEDNEAVEFGKFIASNNYSADYSEEPMWRKPPFTSENYKRLSTSDIYNEFLQRKSK